MIIMSELGSRNNNTNQSASRTFFDSMLKLTEGDIPEAVASITGAPQAAAFTFGYAEVLDEETPSRGGSIPLAIAGISSALSHVYGADPEALVQHQQIWGDLFSALKIREELGVARFEAAVRAGQLLSEVGTQFLLGGASTAFNQDVEPPAEGFGGAPE